jgi:hypothetical protein
MFAAEGHIAVVTADFDLGTFALDGAILSHPNHHGCFAATEANGL